MRNSLFVCVLFFLISSCDNKIKVDAVYFNGHVFTVDSVFSIMEAFAIKDGKFIAIGTSQEILAKYDSKNLIDLKQRQVYPGFIDAHCHFMGYANDLYKCQLVGTKSFNEVLQKIIQYDRSKNPSFIYGRGWDQNDWEIKEFPKNGELNAEFPNKPVFLKRIDGHAVLVNAAFLNLADSILKFYKNSAFIETKNGLPTGILFDNAMDAVEKLIPALSNIEIISEVTKAQSDCIKLGLTSLGDAGLMPTQIELIDSLQKTGLLKLRIYGMVSATEENLEYLENKGKIKTPYLNVQSLKAYADGALGSRGARLKTDYSDKPHHCGSMNISADQLSKYALWAYQHNFQMNTHAIGDSGNAFVLKVYSEILKEKNDLRWRIEHAQVIDLMDINDFNTYSIIPSVQPTHATSDMPWAIQRLGASRMFGAYAYQSLLKQNGWLPLGTDFPVEYLNPEYTFFAAVGRRDEHEKPDSGFQKEESLLREQALRGMTIWAAKAAFEEQEKGSIETGKYADFLIFDEDFMKDELRKLRNATPQMTIINGEIVYRKDKN